MICKFFHRTNALLSLALCLSGFSGGASASGFALIEQSASGLGNAFAAGAAATDDASVQFFNPAAMTELSGTQISLAGHYIMPSAKLTNAGATVVTLGNIPVTGTVDDAGVNGLVPNFYYACDLNPQLKFGLGINAPFGLSTEYDKTWIGRYHAIKSKVQTIDINPALAYKVSNQLSLGAGLNAQYIKAELSSAVDSSSICLGLAPLATCGALGLASPGNQAVDSYATIKGDDWSYGYNFGLLFKPADDARIGFAFRSKIKQSLKGDATFTRSAAFNLLLGASPLFTNTTDAADIELPASAALSIAEQVNPRLELLADITWTQWSALQELRVTYGNPAQPDTMTTENWDNTLRYAVGLSYKLDDRIKLRTGLAYDQSPVPDARHRTARIPDNDRTWLALGMSYASNDNLSYDVGYAHLFVNDTAIDNTTEAAIQHNLQGTYQISIDILSAQLNYRF
jgi:long-chain fatty acid transport protein